MNLENFYAKLVRGEKDMKKIFIPILLALAILSACGSEETEPVQQDSENGSEIVKDFPQLTEEAAENEALVDLNTSMGTIQIKLFPELAPKTVENFLTHAEEEYYDGVIFHRVMKDFMVQGGDPTGTGGGGESIYGATFEDEFSNQLFNFRGALSMANAGPGTNGSQFFIVQANKVADGGLTGDYPQEVLEAYEEKGGTPWLDGKHTVFGQVVEGMDVVDAIAAVETENDKPVKDITIESIDILQQ